MNPALPALALLFLASITSSAEQERIRFWVKAFIPNHHPGNPSYVRPVPGQNGKSMIPGPVGGACFLTDHRTFSNDPLASARLTTEFELVIDGTSARIERVSGRDVHRCDSSSKVDCSTGQVLATATGQPRTAAIGESFGIGGPHIAGDKVQVIFQTAASNPLTPSGSPDIDASFDLIYDRGTGDLQFKATVGAFPAFEAYVAKNGREPLTLFRVLPEGKTVWSLTDGGLGLNSRSLSGKIALGSPLEGSWSSTDPKKRFGFEMKGDNVVVIERSEDGKEFRRSARLQPRGTSGTFLIERSNDDEVLQFFGFSSQLRTAILANGLKPSFFEIRQQNDRLYVTWNGFVVIKDAKGNFKELRQPGKTQPRNFEFVR